MIWDFKCPKEVAIVGALSFRNADLIEAMELFASGTNAMDFVLSNSKLTPVSWQIEALRPLMVLSSARANGNSSSLDAYENTDRVIPVKRNIYSS